MASASRVIASPRGSLLNLHLLLFFLLLSTRLMHGDDKVPSSLHKPDKGLDDVELADLVTAILNQQYNATTSFSDKHPATLAGLFPSEVRIHFYGEAEITAMRNKYAVSDLTSLPTLLILNALVEATLKLPIANPPVDALKTSLMALDSFRSPSFGESNSSLMAFWPVHAKEGPPEKWTTWSENAVRGGGKLNPFILLQNAVNTCKGKCPLASTALTDIKHDSLCAPVLNESLSSHAKRHNFPPDLTSSFANLALGALLQQGGQQYASLSEEWQNQNADFTQLVDDVYRFSYRPLSSKESNNVIDSRMYYVIEKFLAQRKSENAAFVSHWIPQSSPEGRVVYGSQTLPAYNTIDLFGTATFLLGVTSAVLNGMVDHSRFVRVLIRSNLDLMCWIVSNGRQDDLDLLMTSHPSRFQLYWMLSRSMFEMESARIQGKEGYKLLEEFYTDWNTTVRGHVTEAVLRAIKDGGLDVGGSPLAYVDDTLISPKVDDKTQQKMQVEGNDRLHATASAASCLLSAWTVHNAQHQLLFLPDTPNDVALATKRLVNYVISEYHHNKDTSLANVIHSTVHKHCQSLPYWFPSNSVVTKNGDIFNGVNPTPEVLFGMRGRIPSGSYETMLIQPHYGQAVSNPLPGLSTGSSLFFFWSSPAYTGAICTLATAQMKNTKGQAHSIEALTKSFQNDGRPK